MFAELAKRRPPSPPPQPVSVPFEGTSGKVKIVFLSDTHNTHGKLIVPDGDVLVCSGDFTENGTLPEVAAFNQFLGTLPHPHKLVICGNHELGLAHCTPTEIQKYLSNATYLQDSGVTVLGLHFFGSPWVPKPTAERYAHNAFVVEEAVLKEKWEGLPTTGVDVLITHNPPLLNTAQDVHGRGCPLLAQKVAVLKPKVHVFGHMHSGSGYCVKGATLFINAANDESPVHHTTL
eukprot:TRINITY_DN70692_c0_g1_i1.p1 TRINITY_DN70692_c0_g1~~TRINITY_DN70692_c0_g1_i1.p1  ORF type:complete len:233 (+),score=21.38 TRINITY_DN70692_c0_g1_i1:78-776(+)